MTTRRAFLLGSAAAAAAAVLPSVPVRGRYRWHLHSVGPAAPIPTGPISVTAEKLTHERLDSVLRKIWAVHHQPTQIAAGEAMAGLIEAERDIPKPALTLGQS